MLVTIVACQALHCISCNARGTLPSPPSGSNAGRAELPGRLTYIWGRSTIGTRTSPDRATVRASHAGIVAASSALRHYFLSCRGPGDRDRAPGLACAASGKSGGFWLSAVRRQSARVDGAAQLCSAREPARNDRRRLGLSPPRHLWRLRQRTGRRAPRPQAPRRLGVGWRDRRPSPRLDRHHRPGPPARVHRSHDARGRGAGSTAAPGPGDRHRARRPRVARRGVEVDGQTSKAMP